MKPKNLFSTILAGRPKNEIECLSDPEELLIPLKTDRFEFGDLAVEEGQRVEMGTVLARDADRYSLPLLAPRGGVVRLEKTAGHIVLEEVQGDESVCEASGSGEGHIQKDDKTAKIRLRRLFDRGAWSYIYNAHDRSLPSPDVAPKAVIVSTLRLEPFLVRGNVQIGAHFDDFVRGLEHLQSLVEYQPIYLVMAPAEVSEDSARIQDAVRGYASVKVVTVDPEYPNDNFALLAQQLKVESTESTPVWCLHTCGVLAMEKALSKNMPETTRTVAVAGPGIQDPVHVKAVVGYPIAKLLANRLAADPVRVIYNGVYTGRMLGEETKGLDLECGGLTVLAEQTKREFLSFINPGFDKRGFSNTFASMVRGRISEKKTTGVYGERRPCVNCQFCEDVCPVGLMPYYLHKLIYQDQLETLEKARLDLCIECGLCSYVCPSKIELREQFIEAKVRVKDELHSAIVDE